MTKKDASYHVRWAGSFNEGSQNRDPLDRLRNAIDAAGAEPTPDADLSAATEDWAQKAAKSGILRQIHFVSSTLEVLAQITPPASVTEEGLARVERERIAVRGTVRTTAALEAECTASSPAELFQILRERAGITAEQAADLFSVTPATWLAVERKQRPWYQLASEAVPAFAEAVREPVERVLTLIAIAARRALFSGVEKRASLSLGRYDNTQGVAEARRDTLRLAFARMEDENRGAARFLEGARRAIGFPQTRRAPDRHDGSKER